MRFLALITTTLTILSACAQHANVPAEVPYGREPATPMLKSLEAVADQEASELVKHSEEGQGGEILFYFTLKGERFSGWSVQEFPGNEHRHRFIRYDDGWPVWQIGYYANGNRDMDFHMKKGKSLGSERMWRSNGDPYIDYFYSDIDQMDGLQRRWHAGKMLAYQADYKNGQLVYEIAFDESGVITDLKGDVPEELLNSSIH